MPNHRTDIAGHRFGKIKAISRSNKSKSGNFFWVFRCDCGNLLKRLPSTVRSNFRSGMKVSCYECKSRNDFVHHGDWISLDVSTKSHPDANTSIDAEDLSIVLNTGGRWHAAVARNGLIYVTQKNGPKLHRLIMDAPKGMEVDHIDGDPLNNTRRNLRIVTARENRRNTRVHSRNKTGCSGVMKTPYGYSVYISIDEGQKNFGSFHDFDEAVAVRKRLEKEYGYHPNHGRTR